MIARICAVALLLWAAGCAAPGAPPVHPDQDGPIHGELGGGGGGGSM